MVLLILFEKSIALFIWTISCLILLTLLTATITLNLVNSSTVISCWFKRQFTYGNRMRVRFHPIFFGRRDFCYGKKHGRNPIRGSNTFATSRCGEKRLGFFFEKRRCLEEPFMGWSFFGGKRCLLAFLGWGILWKDYLGQTFGSPNFKVRFGSVRWNGGGWFKTILT